MVEYLFLSLFAIVIGIAVVVAFAAVALPRARARRELARRKAELAGEDELEQFIRRVDQVTSAEQLDHLDEEKRDD